MNEVFDSVWRAVMHNRNPGVGPYEAQAGALAQAAQDLIERNPSPCTSEDVDRLIALARVYAILNLTDELTRFINTEGITVNGL